MRSRVMCLVASVCVYIWGQKTGCLRSYCLKSRIGAVYTARSSSLTTKKGAYYTRWFVQRKKFRGIPLTGREWFLGNFITVSHTLSTCNAASYAMLLQLHVQTHSIATGSLYWQCLARTGYVFCGTPVGNENPITFLLSIYHNTVNKMLANFFPWTNRLA